MLPKGSRAPRTLEIIDLYRQGTPPREIAARFGMRNMAVQSMLWRARQDGLVDRHNDNDAAIDMTGERCRCGLRLPCNQCLPVSAAEFAQQRREHWSDGGGNDGEARRTPRKWAA